MIHLRRLGILPLLLALWVSVACPLHGQPSGDAEAAFSTRDLLALRTKLSRTGRPALLREDGSVVGSEIRAGDLVRLRLPRHVLEATRPDLSDVRLFLDDREIPHVVRRAPAVERQLVRTVVPELGPRLDRSAASVDERAPLRQREVVSLSAPPPAADGAWTLRMLVPPARGAFVRSARLSWLTEVGGDPSPFWEGSFFRLEDGRERLDVELPAGASTWLLVELEGQEGERGLQPLEPQFSYRLRRPIDVGGRTIAFDVDTRHVRQDGTDIYRFSLPPGLVPGTLRVGTSTGAYRRPARVLGARDDASPLRVVGAGVLRGLGVGETTIDGSLISIEPAGVTHYEIHVESGDSPPLDDVVVEALLNAPELVFEWPGDGVELLYGGGRVRAPDYDLASILPARSGAVDREDVPLVDVLFGDGTLPLVRTSDVINVPNESFLDEPLLAFLQRPGAPADRGRFAYLSEMTLGASPSGLYRVPLGPQALARLSRDLGDLRFVDERGQWPFLVGDSERWAIDLELAPRSEDRRTRLELRLPDPLRVAEDDTALRVDRLELVVDAPYFDRAIELRSIAEESAPLVRERLVGAEPRTAFFAPAVQRRTVTLRFPERAAADLVLTVEDGDDAPLTFLSGRLSGPGREALVVAPEGTYEALLGERPGDEVEPPSYELRRAAPLVRSLRATPAVLGVPEVNPDATAPSIFAGLPWEGVLLWVAIALAVLGLGWITLRSVGSAGD